MSMTTEYEVAYEVWRVGVCTVPLPGRLIPFIGSNMPGFWVNRRGDILEVDPVRPISSLEEQGHFMWIPPSRILYVRVVEESVRPK